MRTYCLVTRAIIGVAFIFWPEYFRCFDDASQPRNYSISLKYQTYFCGCVFFCFFCSCFFSVILTLKGHGTFFPSGFNFFAFSFFKERFLGRLKSSYAMAK